MMAMTVEQRHHRARIAAISYAIKAGSRQSGDPELLEARRSMALASLEENLRRAVHHARKSGLAMNSAEVKKMRLIIT